MSNAQRRREQRHRGKSYPGPMTERRVDDHRIMQTRLADLERLRKLVVAQMAIEERESVEHTVQAPTEGQDEAVWDEVDETQSEVPDLPEEDEPEQDEEESGPCPVCQYPQAGDASLAHILAHNAEEVSGAVTVDWSGADSGNGYPTPYRFRVFEVGTGVQLYPARVTIMADAAANLAVVDITELINADGAPIRSNTQGKMGVHTPEYTEWSNSRNAGEGTDDESAQYMGDKYVTVVNRFVLASAPVRDAV